MSKSRWELKPESLRAVCDPDSLGFEITLDLAPTKERVVGQERAKHALEFGLGIKDPEYNIFVAGPPRAGKTEMIKAYVAELAASEPAPPDYIYVHNFKDPEQPKALSLPPGKGRALKADMEELISTLKVQIPEVFESEDYTQRREALKQKSTTLHTEMNEVIRKIRKMEKEFQEMERKLDQDVAMYVVGHLIQELLEKYKDLPQVTEYFQEVQDDILKNIEDLKRRPGAQGPFPFPTPEPSFVQYQVNVFVD